MSKIALGIASFVHFILELAASLKGIGIHLVRVAIFIIFCVDWWFEILEL